MVTTKMIRYIYFNFMLVKPIEYIIIYSRYGQGEQCPVPNIPLHNATGTGRTHIGPVRPFVLTIWVYVYFPQTIFI